MRLYVENKDVNGKPVMEQMNLVFESQVEKTMFRLLTDNMLRHGTHVAVSTIIDSNDNTIIGFRPVDVEGAGRFLQV